MVATANEHFSGGLYAITVSNNSNCSLEDIKQIDPTFFFQKCFINVLNNNIFEALFDHQSHIFYIIKQRISIHHHHHHIRGRAIKRVLCPFSNFLIFGEYLLHLNVSDNQTDFIIIQVIQKYPKSIQKSIQTIQRSCEKICGDEPLTRLWRNFGLFLTLPELDWKILIG